MKHSAPVEEGNKHDAVTFAGYEAHLSNAPTPGAAYSDRRRDILGAVFERGGRRPSGLGGAW
ncbi:MAG: hypothetical protein WAO33_03760 [Candidatus Nanopelagicales bacterium]